MAVSSRRMQHRIFVIIFRLDAVTLSKDRPHCVPILVLCCSVQCCSVAILCSVDAAITDLVCQNYIDNALVTPVCSLVKRSSAIFVFG